MLGFLRYGHIWLISLSGCLGHHNEGMVLYSIKFRAGGRGQGRRLLGTKTQPIIFSCLTLNIYSIDRLASFKTPQEQSPTVSHLVTLGVVTYTGSHLEEGAYPYNGSIAHPPAFYFHTFRPNHVPIERQYRIFLNSYTWLKLKLGLPTSSSWVGSIIGVGVSRSSMSCLQIFLQIKLCSAYVVNYWRLPKASRLAHFQGRTW